MLIASLLEASSHFGARNVVHILGIFQLSTNQIAIQIMQKALGASEAVRGPLHIIHCFRIGTAQKLTLGYILSHELAEMDDTCRPLFHR